MVAVLFAVLLVAGGAQATGWLVNVEVGAGPGIGVKSGTNVFGGQGDTVDVGVFNHQCSDEDDVADVGVANREGDSECAASGQGCQATSASGTVVTVGGGPVIFIPTPGLPTIGPDTYHSHDPHCSDDGDTVDVGLANHEGGFGGQWGEACDEQVQYESDDGTTSETYGGDEGDAVDVGVANRECVDNEDAVDAGVFNCEWRDLDDGIDVGLANLEEVEDGGDTFDASTFNTETRDAVDNNGYNLGPGIPLYQLCFAFPDVFEQLPI